nr:hypothetical protein [Bradyrhizobium arachidis]
MDTAHAAGVHSHGSWLAQSKTVGASTKWSMPSRSGPGNPWRRFGKLKLSKRQDERWPTGPRGAPTY